MKSLSVVLSGDPKRKPLFSQIKDYYQKHPLVEKVFLLYTRNPAISFNQGTQLSETEKILYTADVYIPYETINKIEPCAADGQILFLIPPTKKQDVHFCSGAFITTKKTVLNNPIPEEPDFMEEILYQQNKKLKFKAYPAKFVHAHKHSLGHIIKLRNERYLLRCALKETNDFKKILGITKLALESIFLYFKERIQLAKFHSLC